MTNDTSRRKWLKQVAAGSLAVTALPSIQSFATMNDEVEALRLKGNINHSVCQWTYNYLSLEELCLVVKKLGFAAIDLIGPKDWPILKSHGIDSSMCNGAQISLIKGWNDKQYHSTLIKNYSEHIELVAAAGYKNLICFSGSRRGKTDEEGWNNCVEGLKPMVALAEKHNVILVMELLNSKIDHKDYQCDRVEWGAELCRRLGSENFKLLYDIYHMQIDEGDVIRNIRANHQYIAHYHTGGVPGRNEIDETQELYYPAIMRAIVEVGHKGFVAQEFIPKQKDKIASLKKAVHICDV